ncbi:MAG TPA: DUF2235 domain-containing protein [Castellaniella sp.]|nr:DUF2235 domain-containing protein [Castellaniella sp.]
MSGTPIPRGFRRACGLLAVLLLTLTAMEAARSAPGVCRAPANPTPCGAALAPSAAGEPDLDTGLSNPVSLITGAKHLKHIDLPAPLDGNHPAFIRFYRMNAGQGRPSPSHWTHEYDIRLEPHRTGWRLALPDGQILSFDARGMAVGHGTGRVLVLPAAPASAPAEATRAWVQDDGLRMDFNGDGLLLAIRAPQRSAVRIERHGSGPLAGLIHRVHGRGAALTLDYGTVAGVTVLMALRTPAGTFRYDYDPHTAAANVGGRPPYPRLVRVTRPDGMTRTYHYEAERQAGHRDAVTGITLTDARGGTWRARTWSYDTNGRVIRATPGDGDHPHSTLAFEYGLPGTTAQTHITRVRGPSAQTDIVLGIRSGRIEGTRTRIDTSPSPPGPSSPTPAITDLAVRRDSRGRLTAIGPLHIRRHPDGRIRSLREPVGGWPGLTLEYDRAGRRSAWSSALTGRSTARFDARDRLAGLRYANGDALDIARNAAGRPSLLHYTGDPGREPATVRLQWHGPHLRRLLHPAEQESRQYNEQGRLSQRSVRRPHPAGALNYREAFSYDPAGRLIRHDLPEGGTLHYEWGAGSRLAALTWETRDRVSHSVIRTQPGQAGYRYGNGMHLQPWGAPDGRTHTLIVSDGSQPVWGEQRQSDGAGRIVALMQSSSVHPPGQWRIMHRRYVHDAEDRMVASQEADEPALASAAAAPPADWFAWEGSGALAARRGQAHSGIRRDASGLPLAMGSYRLHYQAQRRLAKVQPAQGDAIDYTHNAHGHTIRRREGTRETERYYLDNRLVALWQRPEAAASRAPGATPVIGPRQAPTPTFGVTQRYLYAHDVPVGLLQSDRDGHTHLYYIHADSLGAPVLVTDEARTVRWSATYDSLGRARTRGNLDLPLRAPGQDEDPATGWHDNIFRTYLPTHGQYLEPDPLGPVPGQQALGYAAQQPMRYTDPLGLILLAFDGTRLNRGHQSNVWKLAQIYQDGPSLYHPGPGNGARLDWDALTAASSGQILRTQWESLLAALRGAQDAARPIPIDILGFSRGAALARDFANRIARQTRNGWFSYDDPVRGVIGRCVELRFLGLFDTVAQFGLLGAANAGYDLTIAGAWQWVAHAVALHEFRALFPLVSATSGAPGNVVESPFIGAHSDIGGGTAPGPGAPPVPSGDLSDVALNWMRWQALAATVPLGALPEADRHVSQAILHDERLPMDRILENSDRALQDATTRSMGLQRHDLRLGEDQRRALDVFIQRLERWQVAPGNVVGTVDMQGYGAWLETELGLPGLGGS